MKDILVKVQKKYKERVKKVGKSTSVGLCFIAYEHLTRDERETFDKYLRQYVRENEQKIFYNCEDIETNDSFQFMWRPRDSKVRLNWLKEQISKF